MLKPDPVFPGQPDRGSVSQSAIATQAGFREFLHKENQRILERARRQDIDTPRKFCAYLRSISNS